MKVLVACEFSGVVREAFRKRGHIAFSCDILPCDVIPGMLGYHFQKDVLEILDQDWDLMIAHPPCTYLSNAGACRLYPTKGNIDYDRFKKGLEAKEFFLKLLNAPIPKICIENPVSSTVFNMPIHSQEIQPWMFGHPYSKKTRLWLKNLPPLLCTNIISGYSPFLPSGTGRKDKTKYGAKECAHESKARSVTFQGIANAMAEQWG